ncbi:MULTISPECIES: HTH-type transcriptional repressor FabR [Marinobacter]|uniref:HTH-type transcriptional repressor FabR n=1 Tax=Marinobacter xiaoshiensis TaxID=3073652 RepID=A0ABU2HFN3_9GAMM|nr:MULTISPECIES: HTH-type transcriptional repressor FabR [unclassified Marinobacter]MBK1871822.1 HTH-type transcriptional repressor FabR [Marinobacter sp. 1-3A]MBK1885862.1 HTH-type transcriptional repressor FabR [Marinobacter sp. DY40_1A1]MDS1309852.1 HTH-type transcriptional repressor FabR [Marinobacter sp. F60267]
MSTRAEQKLLTRRSLMDAALAQLSPDRGFGSLSLREVAREAGIAPTSFYRHFVDLDELGLVLVDEGGVALRQLMRQARKRIARDGSAISTSVETFMEYLGKNANLFRLMLRERTGGSKPFRTAIKAEIDHFVTELADDLRRFAEEQNKPLSDARMVAEAMVTLVFNQGADALDATPKEREELKVKLKTELRMILIGSQMMARHASIR